MGHFQSITYSYLHSSTLTQCKTEECGYSGSTSHSSFHCDHINKSYVWSGWGSSRLHPACLLLYSCPYPLALSTNPKWLPLVTLSTTKFCVNRMVIWLERNIVCFTGKVNTSKEICKMSVHCLLFLTMQYFRLSQQCS